MQKPQEVRNAIESIAALPPLPATAKQAMQTFSDEFVDADTIVNIVKEDAGITAKLIGLSNSAYYGLVEPVDDVFDAVSRVIGVETVRSIVLAMAMQKTLDRGRCGAFDAERFWRESLLTAQCAKKIAARDKELTDHERRLSYIAGLCHNIGLMALAYVAPVETNRILAENTARHQRFHNELEKEAGISHRQATALLARKWGLPGALVQAFDCRVDPRHLVESRLGLVLISATSAVGNLNISDDHAFCLEDASREMGIAINELQAMALPGERQLEQIETLASSMGR